MKRRRFFLKILLAGGLLLVLLVLAAWRFPEQILTVDSGPVKADVLVVTGGTPDRARRAAELFKEGEAPKILVSGFGDDVSNMHTLERRGVPASDVILEGKSRTTRQNAEFSIPLLREMGAKRVIIVTSWYHSRRALHCFEHYAPDITFYSRPSYFGYAGRTEDGRQRTEDGSAYAKIATQEGLGQATPHPTLSPAEAERVLARQKVERKRVRRYADSEYVKLLGYWVCYGVCPF